MRTETREAGRNRAEDGSGRRTTGGGLLLAVAALLLALSPRPAPAQQPVNSATGVTLFPAGSVIRSRVETRSLEAPEGGRSVDALLVPTSINYGASTNLTLGATIPWVQKELTVPRPGGPALRPTARGVGDVSVAAKYRYFLWNGHGGKTVQLAALGGLQLPTGGTDATGPKGEPLPMPLQTGSGSTDLIGALTGTGIWQWRTVHVSVLYKKNTVGDRGFRSGDLLNYNLALNARVWHEPYPGPELYLGAELNGEYRRRSERNGTELADTGGNKIFVSPTLVFFMFRNLTLESSVQVPVVQDLNGPQPEEDVRVVAGFRFQYGLYDLF